MKKLFILLIGLILLPSIVSADMAAPTIVKYKASVNNPDGIDIYKAVEVDEDEYEIRYEKTEKKLAFGITIELYDEGEWDDGFVPIDDNDKEFVKVTELSAVDNEYKVNKRTLDNKPYDALVIKNAPIKSGPATGYKTLKTLNAGEKIQIRDISFNPSFEEGAEDTWTEEDKKFVEENDNYEDEFNPWKYIEYSGVKGYITTYDDSIAYNIKDNEIVTSSTIEIYDVNTLKVIKTIPVGTKLSVKTGWLNNWTNYIYIEVDGIKGYTNQYDFAIKLDKAYEFKAIKDIKVYKNNDIYNSDGTYKNDDSLVVTTLKAGTTFNVEYVQEGYDFVLYYEKDNVKGFIISDTDDISSEYFDERFKDEEDEEDEDDEDDEDDEKIVPEENEEKQPEDEKEKPVEKEEKIIKPKSNNNTLYICIGAGIILSITAVVTIILINKKKKQKEL